MIQKTSSSSSVIPAKLVPAKAGSGNPERKHGFRVKPGMTDPKALRKWYPDTTWQLGSDAIASTILTVLECQFMQLMGTPEIFEVHS
jgi:hypothetical protein